MAGTKYQKIQSKLVNLQKQIVDVAGRIVNLETQHASLQRAYKKAEEELERVDKDPLVVSEHAILQYMERVMGYDLNLVRNAIVPPDSAEKMLELGEGTHLVNDVRIVIQGNTVVTVLPKDPLGGVDNSSGRKKGVSWTRYT